jgi:Pectic acid lyase
MNNWYLRLLTLQLAWIACTQAVGQQQDKLAASARSAMVSAVQFMHQKVAVHGGYVYQVSADLRLREGEGVAEEETVWVQPPGTPAVGQAILDAYQRTGEEKLLEAARDAAHCLVNGQLHSGGWQAHIDFGQALRPKQAYRADGPAKKKAKNISSFDDDKSQSAIRFLANYDSATKFSDEKVHESVQWALDAILKNQFPNGGFGQVFENPPTELEKYPVHAARYPNSWPRKYPGGDYWWFYTLNDNNMSRIIDTLFLAGKIYDQPRYRNAAIKAADFLLLAQMPAPQPAWAQQYNFDMEPVWARKFEPAAISGGESQEVIKTLMNVFEETGDQRYLEPIPRALEYLRSSLLKDGKLARFYELTTNRPLYMNTQYELTYEPDDLPKHYGFIVQNRLEDLKRRFEKLSAQKEKNSGNSKSNPKKVKDTRPSDAQVRSVIESLDDRGAWVENGSLRYHKHTSVKQVITSETFIRNLDVLSRFLAE